MVDNPNHFLTPPEEPSDAAEFYATLVNNEGRANTHMKIDVTRINSVVYDVEVYVNGSLCHSDDVRLNGPIGKLTVQSHWGSGVEFSNMSIIKRQP